MKETKTAAPSPAQAGDENRPLCYADLRRFFVMVLGFVLLAMLVGALSKFVLLFAIVFFVAMVLNAPVAWLVRRGLKRGLAVVLVMVCVVAAAGGVIALMVPTMLAQSNQLAEAAPEYGARIESRLKGIAQHYPMLNQLIPETSDLVAKLGSGAQPLATWLVSRTFGVGGGIFLTIVAMLLVVFVLLNPQPLVVGVLSAVPQRHREAARRSLSRIMQQMAAWTRATILMGAVTGVSTGVLLHFAGVRPALVFGALAFFGELVPNIGPFVAAVPALFVAAGEGPSTFLWALAAILFVQQIESNVLVPYIMGSQMELHPFSIIFFALTMGALFGIAGAVLAVPTAATIKILYDEFYLRPQNVPVKNIEHQASDLVSGQKLL